MLLGLDMRGRVNGTTFQRSMSSEVRFGVMLG